MTQQTVLEIWKDGDTTDNSAPAGCGALMSSGEQSRALYGGEPLTTNNRMELTAVIEALSAVKRPVPIVLHLDSSYVKNGITGWVHNWKRRGWRTGEGKPVKNVELWQALDKLAASHTIDWRWVKGHAGDPGNERADELANLGAAQATGRSV